VPVSWRLAGRLHLFCMCGANLFAPLCGFGCGRAQLWEEALRRAARIPDFGVAVRAARARFVAEVEDTSVAARRTLDMEAAR
jgi:hypothetical protein